MKNLFIQRGFSAAKARNPAEAVQWFEKALREDPDDAQTKIWLGQSLCNVGRRQEGLTLLVQAGRQQLSEAKRTNRIDKALETAALLQQRGDFEGALVLLTEAVLIDGSAFKCHQMLAVTYAQLNRKSEALLAGEQALSILPTNAMMQVFQASLEADAGQHSSAKARLETMLKAQPGPRESFRAHKELARILDKLGDFRNVFPHLLAAGAIGARLPEYSKVSAATIPNLLAINRAKYNREILGKWANSSFSSKRTAPVFIVGFMRSGTTLTQEILDAHPDVFVADETDFVWGVQQELHKIDNSSASVPEKLQKLDLAGIERLRKSYWDRVDGRFGNAVDGKLFVDKFTMNTLDLGLINCVFPDAKVLFVMRDPRDVCLSCFMQLMVPTPTTVHLLSWEGTAKLYTSVMDWWVYIQEQMTMSFMELRYENAIADFESTFRDVFAYLNTPWDPGVIDFHKHAAKKAIATPSRTQVAQPLYSSSVSRWQYYEPDFAPIMDTLRPYVARFGYAP